MSFYGFGIHHTLWRPCDSMAKKRQSPNHLRRVFWRLSRCLRVIRINRESLGVFRWYLSKTPGQIEGITNQKRADFSLEMPLATTGQEISRYLQLLWQALYEDAPKPKAPLWRMHPQGAQALAHSTSRHLPTRIRHAWSQHREEMVPSFSSRRISNGFMAKRHS